MGSCPCCDDQLLRRIRSGETYWFCRSCWQEMPMVQLSCDFDAIAAQATSRSNTRNAIVPVSHLHRQASLS
jgi:hypothetical protein